MYLIPLTQSVLLKPDRMALTFTPLSYNHMFWGTELKKVRQRFYQFYLVILKTFHVHLFLSNSFMMLYHFLKK